MKREHVETLRALREEYAGKPGDFSQDRAAIDAAIALAEAVERAPVTILEFGDFNRGLMVDDPRMSSAEWEDRLVDQRVRLLPMAAEGRDA